jgi:LacI family transcriptional regulator
LNFVGAVYQTRRPDRPQRQDIRHRTPFRVATVRFLLDDPRFFADGAVMKTSPIPARRVAILVETATTWGRQVVTGIQNYARRSGRWQTFIEPRGTDAPLRIPSGWRGDGVIARIGQVQQAEDLLRLNCPIVNVSGIKLPIPPLPRVTTDLEASGRLAAEYFLQRGYRHCGYFSLIGLPYVAAHQESFATALAASGATCAVHAVRAYHGAEPNWNIDIAKLGEWLMALPRPVGILTWNASCGRDLLYAAQATGLLVPEDVAVLCGTDDDLFCEFSHIPLSGIRPPGEQIGHAAAALLQRLMQGKAAPAQPQVFPPSGITTRQSTNTMALRDPVLVKALNFIRENATRRIRVTDIARHAGASRRLLENKFMAELRRSPAREIQRVRLERAKELLHRTDLPIGTVAEASGFGSPEYFAFVFSREMKRTPLRYRKEIRSR